MSEINIDLLRKDECQPLTTEQMNDIKSQFNPSNTANVQIIQPPYSPDEHIVTYWREYRDSVLMQKPVYEKAVSGTTGASASDVVIGHVDNIEELYEAKGTIKRADGKIDACPNNSSNIIMYSNGDIAIWCDQSVWFSRPCKVIIRYTKTTDTWQPV